MLKIVC